MGWADRVDQLLYDGERVRCRLEVSTATVVVTSHRLLAFVDSRGGPAYRYVDLPNVGAVDLRREGRFAHLIRAIVAAILGIGLVLTSAAVSFVELVPDPDLEGGESDAPATPATGVLDAVESTLALVDLAVVATGVLSIGIAAVFALLYVRSRSRRLVIEVRGDDDVELPVTGADDVGTAVVELEEAIRPEPSVGALGGPTGSDRDRLEGHPTVDDRHRTVREHGDSPVERTSQDRGSNERRSLDDSPLGRGSRSDGPRERGSLESGESADSRGPTAEFPESADPTSLEPEVPPIDEADSRTAGLDDEGSTDAFDWDPLAGSGSEERSEPERTLETERWWTDDERDGDERNRNEGDGDEGDGDERNRNEGDGDERDGDERNRNEGDGGEGDGDEGDGDERNRNEGGGNGYGDESHDDGDGDNAEDEREEST
ncbi:hypothetical protein FYC77_03650 [Natrialba swarupiae]|uniref:Uncharacterized protein n=2 Tax=Natrialba swarupiae TaxID=2448032 RepID=A0A5D5AMU1_9EURY|nr:hypothetical protein FYC77_03650 [Natrialba swarupiae]